MNEEYEAKFLNINRQEIEAKLKSLGAELVFDSLFRIKVYDHPDLRLHNQGAWVRVRDEGDKVVMTFKQRLGIIGKAGEKNDSGMEEYEIKIDNFDNACLILEKIGLKIKFYEEKKRTRYFLDGVEIDIDHCPGLDPYLEIEGKSWEEVDKIINKLELDQEEKRVFSTYQIYQLQGIEMVDYKELSFSGGLIKKEKK